LDLAVVVVGGGGGFEFCGTVVFHFFLLLSHCTCTKKGLAVLQWYSKVCSDIDDLHG